MPNILVIDDDKDTCFLLSNFLTKHNCRVSVAHTGDEGLKQLRSIEYDLILCDYKLPDLSGVDFLKKIMILNLSVAVIIISAYSDVKIAAESIRLGASDYITKPFYTDELLVTIKEAIIIKKLKLRIEDAGSELSMAGKKQSMIGNLQTENFIVGNSHKSLTIQRHIERIAPANMPVLIHGETGTGKEFVAQSIHKMSSRASRPFIVVNCGALPNEFAGSELFGHIGGSFTGAISAKQGSLELPNGGTIFLDEIENLTYENQEKFLQTIQKLKINSVGAHEDIAMDVRIITATRESLSNLVIEGRFIEELYHRLNACKIYLGPLRERRDDILYFANLFLQRANQSLSKTVKSFSTHVKNYLWGYCWPGNLKELYTVVWHAVLLTEDEEIQAHSLPLKITQAKESAYGVENTFKAFT